MKTSPHTLNAAIVDDEKDLCLLLERILHRQNFNTISLNSLREVKALMSHIHPDVIFLDNQLPDGSGITFIEKLRQNLPDTKIVMMTAFNTENEKEEAFENGADVFLIKPLSRNVIEKTLEMLDISRVA